LKDVQRNRMRLKASAVQYRDCELLLLAVQSASTIAGILTDQDARRSRVLALPNPRGRGAALRCSRKPRQNPSLTGGAPPTVSGMVPPLLPEPQGNQQADVRPRSPNHTPLPCKGYDRPKSCGWPR